MVFNMGKQNDEELKILIILFSTSSTNNIHYSYQQYVRKHPVTVSNSTQHLVHHNSRLILIKASLQMYILYLLKINSSSYCTALTKLPLVHFWKENITRWMYQQCYHFQISTIILIKSKSISTLTFIFFPACGERQSSKKTTLPE